MKTLLNFKNKNKIILKEYLIKNGVVYGDYYFKGTPPLLNPKV